MLASRGLQIAAIGIVICLLGIVGLAFMPKPLAIVLMLSGGLGVMGGFIWTLVEYYLPPSSVDKR
ncbi:MAG TPA: hypothetical protein VNN21_11575 [Dehalococcoidia bacterium]|nr:hypothetical protein [Dehalococcoidia bacterium]